MIFSHLDYHLGDNFVALNYMRRVVAADSSIEFTHAALPQYFQELAPVIADTPNVHLIDIRHRRSDSIDVWKNRGGRFYPHPKRNDWVAYHLEFFKDLSAELGVVNPMLEPHDFLMDYPAIKTFEFQPVDCIFINGPPLSGQLRGVSPQDLEMLVNLLRRNYSVMTTEEMKEKGLSLTALAAMSLKCKYIIGVATGPMWPMLNIWNDDKLKLFLLNNERVNISPNTHHAESLAQAMNVLKREGVL